MVPSRAPQNDAGSVIPWGARVAERDTGIQRQFHNVRRGKRKCTKPCKSKMLQHYETSYRGNGIGSNFAYNRVVIESLPPLL